MGRVPAPWDLVPEDGLPKGDSEENWPATYRNDQGVVVSRLGVGRVPAPWDPVPEDDLPRGDSVEDNSPVTGQVDWKAIWKMLPGKASSRAEEVPSQAVPNAREMGPHERAILTASALEHERVAAGQRVERMEILKWYDQHILSLESVLDDYKRQKESREASSVGEAPEPDPEGHPAQEVAEENARKALELANRTRESLRLGSARQDVRDQEDLPKEPTIGAPTQDLVSFIEKEKLERDETLRWYDGQVRRLERRLESVLEMGRARQGPCGSRAQGKAPEAVRAEGEAQDGEEAKVRLLLRNARHGRLLLGETYLRAERQDREDLQVLGCDEILARAKNRELASWEVSVLERVAQGRPLPWHEAPVEQEVPFPVKTVTPSEARERIQIRREVRQSFEQAERRRARQESDWE